MLIDFFVAEVLAKVAEAAVEGANVHDLCKLGDEAIAKETYAVYTKKVEGQPIPKGARTSIHMLGNRNSSHCRHCLPHRTVHQQRHLPLLAAQQRGAHAPQEGRPR